jgi:DNA-binding CsgD family transcriptional regulator
MTGSTRRRGNRLPLQVLQLLAHGEHVGQISKRLGIDKRRVYWVREKLRRRFGATTNENLIFQAASQGFLAI